MNLDFPIMFRYRVSLLFTLLGFLIYGCSTSPETKVDEAAKIPTVAVIESVRTDATPDKAVVTFACSQATTHGDPFALANPARISFDIKGTPAEDLPDQVKFKIGPVKEILIKERGAGITGIVVYVCHEKGVAKIS
ncbi:MAG: hypothetical protein ISS62_01620 [Desulfobacteraceae bacterium]|nr:hypothetical protein [Desulfobacteraceae bacterium]